eukprot:CAMPEP_0117009748 /NCGR_PEP_ID=MMETSP0472-20121206/8766_1 /TAXON_ID=693140 ORGANISM="Tiarina fusus, Strain LIS" /NCGR_SAMPLE_ID=MMETSP0472 /ASSEMBLY_ACC=CAM_ASM_000603 /LENGTH=434 /DNA_ID=CAMNT_0004712103 /DNA_START=16 /DNA_END=1320 /DNA_ORIENTATION=+
MGLFFGRKTNDANVEDVNDVDDIEHSKSSDSHAPPLSPEERKLQSLLADGAYHLPGNTWREDWRQYFGNNHPLLSPCFQHRLHPISKAMRAVGLFGSVMAGLVITNVFFLWFVDLEEQEAVFELSAGGFAVQNGTSFVVIENEDHVVAQYTSFEFSTGMLILWSVGSATHALFDITIWYATSCSCLGKEEEEEEYEDADYADHDAEQPRPQTSTSLATWVARHRTLVNALVVTGVILIAAMASLAVVVRVAIEGGNDVDTSSLAALQSEGLDGEAITNKHNYEFLTSYAVELALAWFLWFPVVETILFSGVLSCGGRLSCLGGRPAELREAAESEETTTEEEGEDKLSKTDIFQDETQGSTDSRANRTEQEGHESIDIATPTTKKAKKKYKLPDSAQSPRTIKPRPPKHPPRSSPPAQVKRKPTKHPPRSSSGY